MTDHEINKAVAEAAGYEIRPSSGGLCFHVMDGDTHIGGIAPRGNYESGFSTYFDPLHDANQAIEALNRVFGDTWSYERKGNRLLDVPTKTEATGATFCDAACNAILAATTDKQGG